LQTKIRFLRKMKSGRAKSATPRIEERQLQGMASGPLLKRLFDILISAIALIILSPLFLLIALAIKLESSGPVFYISKRAGRGYRIFNFFKFRTMEHGADKKINELTHLNQYGFNNNHRSPVFFKISNDPRITRVGSFLRNTSLDELPQLINVFLGNMSLVGNRPLPLYEAVALTTDDYAARFMAPAGITGLWQIKKRGNKDMSAEERIHIDIDYASKCNFVYDLWIIANTPSALLQKENV
ncbi:MAG: sugar transferase, partial [Bacteroidota bacterium]|nr:sugar transferase [Bacteroidota bacterium]